MRKYILLVLMFFILTGCQNKEEEEKSEYIAMKSQLLETKKYSEIDQLPCEITVDIKRKNEEKVNYNIEFFNPTEDMHKVKVIAVHNYYAEELYPSIGLFDKTSDLIVGNDDKIVLNGTLKTTENIDNIKLSFKMIIEYYDNNNKKKDIYYKTK